VARSYDGSTVEFVNWSSYNPRTDSKKPSWFRLDNTFLTGPKFFDLDAGQKLLGVLLMSLVSQSNGSPIALNYEYLSTFTKLSFDQISKAVEIYIDRETLRVTRARSTRVPKGNILCPPATDGRTDGRTDTAALASARGFDFESLYQRYPRKLGKQKGIERCRKQILTAKDYEDLSRAIDRYRSYVRAQSVEEKYIKHFSTFMASYRDWLDPDAGSSIVNQPYHPVKKPVAAIAEIPEQPEDLSPEQIREIIESQFGKASA
jgi:hypothetical protein